MEQRLGATTWRMTVNEKKFIENSLLSDLRIDGRRPFDYRRLTIKFGRFFLYMLRVCVCVYMYICYAIMNFS